MIVTRFIDAGACWVCGADALSPFHQAVFELDAYREQDPELASYTGAEVWLRQCTACGFAQPDRLPALPHFFERVYDQLWSPEWVEQEFEGTYKDYIFRRILYVLGRRVPTPTRTLLDVGAHAGRFMHMARQAGWRAEGIELNPRTAAYAARRTGLPVQRLNAQQLTMIGRRYDAVTLIDVLEHIPDPVTILGHVRSAVVPGGSIAVKVPCAPVQRLKEEWRSRLRCGYRPRLADNLVHVNHFSPRALRLALERAGFESILIEPAAPECAAGHGAANLFRLAIYFSARWLPSGVRTPLTLNLQAYARNPG